MEIYYEYKNWLNYKPSFTVGERINQKWTVKNDMMCWDVPPNKLCIQYECKNGVVVKIKETTVGYADKCGGRFLQYLKEHQRRSMLVQVEKEPNQSRESGGEE